MMRLVLISIFFMCMNLGIAQNVFAQGSDFNVLLVDAKKNPKRLGVGVVVDGKGHIVTSSALMGASSEMFVYFQGDNQAYTAILDRTDDDIGLALLTIEGKQVSTHASFSSRKAISGGSITTLGLNSEKVMQKSTGTISTMVRKSATANFFKHNAVLKEISYGSSVVNECGELLGVNVTDPFLTKRLARRLPDPENILYTIGEVDIRRFLTASSVVVSIAKQNCLTAKEKIAHAEQELALKKNDIKAKDNELARKNEALERAIIENKRKADALAREKIAKQDEKKKYEQVLITLNEKEARVKAIQEQASAAEILAKKRQYDLDQALRDGSMTNEQRIEAEEAAKKTRKEAEQAAIDAAAFVDEIDKLKKESKTLEQKLNADKKYMLYALIGGGVLLLSLITLSVFGFKKRNSEISNEKGARYKAEAKLAETFADIECRGVDNDGNSQAFNVPGTNLLRSPQGVIVGRQPTSATILINHPEVSRAHVKFSLSNGSVSIEDLETTNGTTINGERLNPHQSYFLRDGDSLGIGKIMFKVKFVGV